MRKLRRALPGDPGFGDPLSTAGAGSARALARIADRVRDDEPAVARELGLGTLQVWQAALERVGRGKGEAEVTVVFTDLVGFSTWSLDAGDATTLTLLRKVAKAVEPPLGKGGGQVVKRMGDGVMAVFSSPARALAAALDAHDAVASVDVDGYVPTMRVGLHTGTPRRIGDDWIGVDVTVAARMMQLGGDGHVIASSATLDALPDGTLDRIGATVRPWRRGLFAPMPAGVPADLSIWRVQRT
ncbi:adenylate/guanylate cyclase domain-containing protein [Rhodococcus sp. HNM0569]|uniref:adenylate/guanylate cyclase domain-containing protein n=1 Tax=Rhodococcus sp. HNM0569 TaxID=2716340 RepID=UPI00146D159E|nr:adenylate/guanylate cyclase domain-containing protein [Rhodococcus sp. HNM0569]NLU83155.1 adenylate/guanylate cyclase domain-containing protein [Rhodococcus sp. HNM0569]